MAGRMELFKGGIGGICSGANQPMSQIADKRLFSLSCACEFGNVTGEGPVVNTTDLINHRIIPSLSDSLKLKLLITFILNLFLTHNSQVNFKTPVCYISIIISQKIKVQVKKQMNFKTHLFLPRQL